MSFVRSIYVAGAIVFASSTLVLAADLGGSMKDSGWHGTSACFLMRRSPILDMSSAADMQVEVEKRYEHSVEVANTESVIASRRPVFPWAVEAKVACGKAIGYFNGREINEPTISKCDCYYGRMLAHQGHR